MSREEALELIERLPFLRTFQAHADKVLEEFFMEAVSGCDPVEWAKVIKTCYIRRTDTSRKRKPLTKTEQKLGRQAEKMFNAQVAAALEIPAEKVESFIQKHLAEDF